MFSNIFRSNIIKGNEDISEFILSGKVTNGELFFVFYIRVIIHVKIGEKGTHVPIH